MMMISCRWKAWDFAALKQSSVSFFNVEKHETAVSRWARARTRAAKVGKGLSKNEKARQLALQHWLEAVSTQKPFCYSNAYIVLVLYDNLLTIFLDLRIDPRHRYGHNLHMYYDLWFESESNQPFFYW